MKMIFFMSFFFIIILPTVQVSLIIIFLIFIAQENSHILLKKCPIFTFVGFIVFSFIIISIFFSFIMRFFFPIIIFDVFIIRLFIFFIFRAFVGEIKICLLSMDCLYWQVGLLQWSFVNLVFSSMQDLMWQQLMKVPIFSSSKQVDYLYYLHYLYQHFIITFFSSMEVDLLQYQLFKFPVFYSSRAASLSSTFNFVSTDQQVSLYSHYSGVDQNFVYWLVIVFSKDFIMPFYLSFLLIIIIILFKDSRGLYFISIKLIKQTNYKLSQTNRNNKIIINQHKMNPHNSNILIKSNNNNNPSKDKDKSHHQIAGNSKSLTKRKQNTELTQRVYEQMLSNYYQTKYSKLMSKLTKQEFNINYNALANHDNNNQNSSSISYPYQSERKNYMTNNISNMNNSTQLGTQNKKRKNFKELIRQKQMRSELSLKNEMNQNTSRSQNKNNKKQSSIASPHRCEEQRLPSKNQKSQKGSTSPRKNFKQSIRQKSKQDAQYRQNLQIYKKLESSIIKELYSPSPKKIQSGKYSILQLRNSKNIQKSPNHNNEDSLFPQNSNRSMRSNRSNKNSIKSSQFPFQNNIQIVEYKYEEDQQHQQHQEQDEQNEFDSRINPFNRQTIKSLAKRRELMQRYSPMKGSSRKSQKSNQSQTQQKNLIQQRAPWNPNFMNQNTFNKSLSNISSDGSKSSPKKKDQTKYGNNNIKLTASQVISNKNNGQSQQNYLKNQKNINKIDEAENEYSHQYFYQKPQFQQKNDDDDFDIQQDDGDIEFILPINDGLNLSLSNRRNNNNDYNFEQNLTQREKMILELQQNNKQANTNHNHSNHSNHFNHSNTNNNNSVNLSQRIPKYNQSQKNFSSKNPSLNNSMNQISMISRFSMTSDEGALIKQKLDHQIINNEFGPYQNALADLRDLINEFPTAWPIYVVGQRTLDDREQYESKRELQKKIMTDYLQRIQTYKSKNSKHKNQSEQQYKIRQNKLKIMRLVRNFAKRTVQMN